MRSIRILVFLVLGIQLLGGCGGSSGSGAGNSNPGGSTAVGDFLVNEVGTDDLIQPSIARSVNRLFFIDASAISSTSIDGVTSDHTVTAEYELFANLESGDNNQLSLYPALQDYSNDLEGSSVALPGAWQRSYSRNGVILNASSTDTNGLFALESQHVFTVPALVLAVPDTALGQGASWSTDSAISTEEGEPLGVLRATGTITSLSSDELTVRSETLFIPLAVDDPASLQSIVEATYDVHTLLILDGNVRSTIAFAQQVRRNGEPVDLSSSLTIVHNIRELAQ
jgi:hypothetical protein